MDDYPELEAAIYANPQDPDAWAVYGDWLQARTDPRGEAVAIGVAIARGDRERALKVRRVEILKANQDAWLSKRLFTALNTETEGYPLIKLDWKYGFIYSARVAAGRQFNFPGSRTTELLTEIFNSPSSQFLQELTIGIVEGIEEGDANFADCIDVIAQAGIRPSIRKLHIGDFYRDECNISRSRIGRLDQLLPLLPNLEWMQVHGGQIYFNELSHSKLKKLTLESGGLPAATIQTLSRGDLPALDYLEIWLGESQRGCDAAISDFKDFFTSTNYPALKHLGLQNSEFQNDIAREIVKAPILAQLKTLDLSMGTMTDEGANTLLESADALKHLDNINLEENFISEECVAKLETTFFGRIKAQKQDSYYDEDDLYVSVGE